MIFSIILLFLFIILPIAAIIMIISAIVRRNKNGDTKSSIKHFEKSTRSIYVYIVLICLLCTIIGGTIYLFNSGLNLILPKKQDTSLYYEYDYKSEMNYSTRQYNKNIVGLFTSSSMLISCIPLFAYYNKLAKKEI